MTSKEYKSHYDHLKNKLRIEIRKGNIVSSIASMNIRWRKQPSFQLNHF